MNILLGIVVAILTFACSSQLWQIYYREKLLSSLFIDRARIIFELESEKLTYEGSVFDDAIELTGATSDIIANQFKIEVFEETDKSATRRTFLMWLVIWAGLIFVLSQIGIGYLILGLTLSLVGYAGKLSKPNAISALQYFRLILKTLMYWQKNDAYSLNDWLKSNKKYATMVAVITQSKK